MKKEIITTCLALLSLGATAQTEVSPYIPGVTEEGITYCLPKTALRFVVTVEKEVYTPGEFAKYADRYLRLQDVSMTPATHWTIKDIELCPYGVPDPDKFYSIAFKKKTIAPLVSLNKDGILLSINTAKAEEELPVLPKRIPASKVRNPRDYMNQDILSAGSNAKIADLTAQEIYDIRESRSALIRGEADNTPKDGEQLKLMMNKLTEQEEALSQLFKGYYSVSTEIFVVNIVPEDWTDKQILFRFSEKLGLVDKDDLAGSPVYVSIKSQQNMPRYVPVEKKSKRWKKKEDNGIHYNVPASALINVFDNTKAYCSEQVSMGQFGYTEMFNNILFEKNATTKITFFQENGGIEQISNSENE